MTAEQFTLWLQGFAELNPTPPTAAQWQSIREHLGTVFDKVTPPLVTEEGLRPRLGLPLDEVQRVRRILRRETPARRDRILC